MSMNRFGQISNPTIPRRPVADAGRNLPGARGGLSPASDGRSYLLGLLLEYRPIEVRQCGVVENVFDLLPDALPMIMLGTGLVVIAIGEPQDAAIHSVQAIDGLDYLPQDDFLRRTTKSESPSPALRGDQDLRPDQRLKDLAYEVLRKIGALQDVPQEAESPGRHIAG
jgi:hypothetical protein